MGLFNFLELGALLYYYFKKDNAAQQRNSNSHYESLYSVGDAKQSSQEGRKAQMQLGRITNANDRTQAA